MFTCESNNLYIGVTVLIFIIAVATIYYYENQYNLQGKLFEAVRNYLIAGFVIFLGDKVIINKLCSDNMYEWITIYKILYLITSVAILAYPHYEIVPKMINQNNIQSKIASFFGF